MDGCSALTIPTGINATSPSEFYSGTLVLILRGSCSFAQKVLNAQRVGALAVAISNDAGKYLIPMTKSDQTSDAGTATTAFMIRFEDYTRIGVALTSSSSSSSSTPPSLTSSSSSTTSSSPMSPSQAFNHFQGQLLSSVKHDPLLHASIFSDVAKVRRSVLESFSSPATWSSSSLSSYQEEKVSKITTSSSGTTSPVVIQLTTLGEDYGTWVQAWDGVDAGDSLASRSWVFWIFPVTALLVVQLYCFMRCARSQWGQQFSQRWFGQGEAEPQPAAVNNNNNHAVVMPAHVAVDGSAAPAPLVRESLPVYGTMSSSSINSSSSPSSTSSSSSSTTSYQPLPDDADREQSAPIARSI